MVAEGRFDVVGRYLETLQCEQTCCVSVILVASPSKNDLAGTASPKIFNICYREINYTKTPNHSPQENFATLANCLAARIFLHHGKATNELAVNQPPATEVPSPQSFLRSPEAHMRRREKTAQASRISNIVSLRPDLAPQKESQKNLSGSRSP